MTIFYVGEIGYEPNLSFKSLDEAKEKALSFSSDEIDIPFIIYEDEDQEEILFIVLNKKLFKPEKD